MSASAILIACLLVLLANLAVLGITVKLYTEILKDRKFDVREVRSGPSTPGVPGHLTTIPLPSGHVGPGRGGGKATP